ncbi:MAG: Signal transduction histidine-protein kinase BaeS [Chloroflexi bacterium ADurb.Bin222]|nr:MAG: Signal transduction histidine-protein kinase BaeS [Chloroflexi bacterium ADurb.Bin222]
MKLWGKLRQGWKRAWRRLNLRFFWQMALAFGLVTLLPLGAVYLVGRQALRQTQAIIGNSPLPGHTLWADRLSRYYQEHGSWDGVETMIAGYPTGPGWEPYDADWQRPYILLSPTGEVIASDNPEQQGENLGQVEQGLAMPIRVNGQLVGRILLSDFRAIAPPPDQPTPLPRVGRIAERMLGSSVYVMVAAVIVGLVLSRGISRPVQEVTDAARAIASGTLSARVSQDHVGEMGELAATFNAMADALARDNELRRKLTADVAHELRTPLSVIRGKLEGILDGVYPATPEQLGPVLEQTLLLTQLVEDLRLLAQAEAGQLPLELRPTDVGDLLRDACVNFTPQAEDRGVTLMLDLPARLPKVPADWRRIAQVLGNLISNALRHTPAGGVVTLSAAVQEQAQAVEVTVSDTGTGIAPEDLPYVFERFWRGDKSRARTEPGSGAGLGLAIARQFVTLHGGQISAESVPHQKTVFRFTLPLAGK